MAVNSTLLDNTIAQQDRSIKVIRRQVALPASGISNGDNVQIYQFPVGLPGRIISASLVVDATLGASATVKAQIYNGSTRSDLTSATTAGGASKVTSSATTNVPYDLSGGEIAELLVGGANISGAANATLILEVTNR